MNGVRRHLALEIRQLRAEGPLPRRQPVLNRGARSLLRARVRVS